MLIVNTILGNIYKDDQLAKKIEDSKKQGKFRRLLLSRIEMEKTRLRKKTDDGFDIGFILSLVQNYNTVTLFQNLMKLF